MASGSVKTVGGAWGAVQSISFPFSPTKDGVVVGFVAPSSSSASYLYITDDGAAYVRGSSTAGSSFGFSFPAKAGHTYAISASSNIGSNSAYKFVPFV